ncbi:alpha-amylase family glycosyl hydrolase [Desulfovibrio sp. DV]|uniref:alpha-amylase family glycosyl hydrolase n=1 Tax=Desulfovibrio sp. DV TaxID=1844708 RepID=UPI00094BC53C|nr:alpha-amylase family glycosyl hydrolase [Desulfovibrio sp. DV]
MYIALRCGAWQVGEDQKSDKVAFKLFFPDRAKDESQYGARHDRPNYGDPRISSIQVAGNFMNHLGLQDWHPGTAPKMSQTAHSKGTLWTYTTPTPLPEGFYQYKYLLTFKNGQQRWVGDPCARYGGTEEQNSAFVIGGSRPGDNTVLPVQGGRKHLRDLILYELMIDDFTDEYRSFHAPLDAIQEKLDYLQHTLGINAILFMPWTAWPNDGYSWGYTPHQYFSIETRYTNDLNAPAEKLSKLKQLVNACHARGIHVIMDGVFNHAGDVDAAGAAAHGFPYRWLYQDPNDSPYVGVFGGTFPGLLDLDYNNGCTQEFIGDVCRYWIDHFGIDGIRFDNTTNYYIQGRNEGLPQLLKDIRQHVKDDNFSLTLEHIDMTAANVVNATGADSYWNDALYGKTFEGLWHGCISPGIMNALDNHLGLDPARVATTYLGNHDHSHVAWQAGCRNNRGALDWYRIQPYAITLMTMPGCPMIPNGQEFAEDYWIMEDDHGTGRRVQPRPLRWNFSQDAIGRSMLWVFSKLIAVRKCYAGLRSNNIYPCQWEQWQTRFNPQGYGVDTEKGLVIFHRWGVGEDERLQRFIIVLNFSDNQQFIDVPFPENGTWLDVLNDNQQVHVSGYRATNVPVASLWGHVYFL